ncbi:Glycerol Kinase 2 [Manis pentadactyla]|nr:Glycerol Kinase 2 [Manis pentadactyla]
MPVMVLGVPHLHTVPEGQMDGEASIALGEAQQSVPCASALELGSRFPATVVGLLCAWTMLLVKSHLSLRVVEQGCLQSEVHQLLIPMPRQLHVLLPPRHFSVLLKWQMQLTAPLC